MARQKKEKIYLPFDRGDQSVIIKNQRTARINFRNLSSQYKDGLIYLVEGILEKEGIPGGEVRKVVRKIEKDRIEIDVNINAEDIIVFAIGLSTFLAKYN